MQTAIHPKYGPATVTCTCGNTFVTGSTKSAIAIELCSACHPFFTGKQKIMDTAGKVSKFEARLAKMAATPVVKKKEKAASRKANKEIKIG
ncbi:MAG: 50S ribosomal protein L31 [Patescibacteria group bacterium]